MKKFLLLFFLTIFSVALYAAPKDFQISTYVSNKNPIGNLSDYSSSYLGVGTAVDYTIPNFPYISFTGRAEVESVISKNPKHSNWWGFTFTGGVIANLDINDFIWICPEVSYGGIVNTVSFEGKNTAFIDQILQLSANLRFYPKFLKERLMNFEIAPVYSLAFEHNTTVNYLGFRIGVNYNFE